EARRSPGPGRRQLRGGLPPQVELAVLRPGVKYDHGLAVGPVRGSGSRGWHVDSTPGRPAASATGRVGAATGSVPALASSRRGNLPGYRRCKRQASEPLAATSAEPPGWARPFGGRAPARNPEQGPRAAAPRVAAVALPLHLAHWDYTAKIGGEARHHLSRRAVRPVASRSAGAGPGGPDRAAGGRPRPARGTRRWLGGANRSGPAPQTRRGRCGPG